MQVRAYHIVNCLNFPPRAAPWTVDCRLQKFNSLSTHGFTHKALDMKNTHSSGAGHEQSNRLCMGVMPVHKSIQKAFIQQEISRGDDNGCDVRLPSLNKNAFQRASVLVLSHLMNRYSSLHHLIRSKAWMECE